jgi:alkylhydroperoxidase family enzyme
VNQQTTAFQNLMQAADEFLAGEMTDDELRQAAETDMSLIEGDKPIIERSMSSQLADATARDYCCATCWSHLIARYLGNDQSTVECAAYGNEHAGFVTRRYADRRRSESQGDVLEVKRMMRQFGAIPSNNRSSAEILAELGF